MNGYKKSDICSTVGATIAGLHYMLAIASIIGAIYVNVHWWIDWVVFLTAAGAFLVFLAVSFIPSFLSSYPLARWGNPIELAALPEWIITACLSAPLFYYHTLIPGHTGFWSWIILSVCILVPIIMSGVSFLCLWAADKKDDAIDEIKREMMMKKKEMEDSEIEAMCDKWRQYALGSGVQTFKDDVVSFLKAVNLRFARQCNMRQISMSTIDWKIVDELIERKDRKELSQSPRPSYAIIRTEFYVDGEIVHALFTLEQNGDLSLSWNNAMPAEQFGTWQDLIVAIEKKL